MRYLTLLLLALVCCYGAEKNLFGLPNNIKDDSYKYDATLKTDSTEKESNGEFRLHDIDEKHLDFLDSFDYQDKSGKSTHVKLIGKVSTDKVMLYLIANDKCVSFEFSKEKGNFPRVGEWRNLGKNKFERTISAKFSLSQLFPNVQLSSDIDANKKYDFREVITLLLDQAGKKIKSGTIKIYADDKLVGTKTFNVNQNMEMTSNEDVFKVPDNCRQANEEVKKQIADGFVRFLQLKNLKSGSSEQSESMSDHQGNEEISQ